MSNAIGVNIIVIIQAPGEEDDSSSYHLHL
jgi:hypothetical protein